MNVISRNRTALMGFSALWIMLYHSSIHFGPSLGAQIVKYVCNFGFFGTDIFLFLSGFGLMTSWMHSRPSLGESFKRRMLRILPSYWLFFLFNDVVLKVFNYPLDSSYILGNIFCIYWFFTNIGFWFISTVLVCYGLFPFFARSFVNAGKKHIVVMYWIGTCLIISLCITRLHDYRYLLMFTLRVPAFIIGSVIGYLAGKPEYSLRINTSVRIYAIISLCCLLLICFLFYYYSSNCYSNLFLCLYPCLVLVFPFTCFAAVGIEIFKKWSLFSFLIRFLNFMGVHSLELYLVQFSVFMTVIFPRGFPVTKRFWDLMPKGYVRWVCAIAVCILFATALRTISLMLVRPYEIIRRHASVIAFLPPHSCSDFILCFVSTTLNLLDCYC
jgi:peptidoglycan/LPS O-acetylase OafA/YrhL